MKTQIIAIAALVLAGRIVLGAPAAPASPANPTAPPWSYFSHGRLLIASSSHQDTAWMGTPAYCRHYRITRVILPALAMMRTNATYAFSIENTLDLMEFLRAHPELRGEVIQRMKEGRFEVGGAYNEPYESWLSGEELVRELYFGRRWIQKHLPGCDTRVYFNPDPPGRATQMQQILAKAGIRYMFISRFHEGLWRWESPDGSSVLAYSPGHYGNALPLLDGPPAKCLPAILAKLDQEGPYYAQRQIPPVYCLVHTMDFSTPTDFNPLIRLWNVQSPAALGGFTPPVMGYSSLREFFQAIDTPTAHFDTVRGERPDVWLYITGPTHHWLASAKRAAARLLPAAETFTTFACLLRGNFQDWPTHVLNQAWKDELYVDHGIGGNNGHITDEVFYQKACHARDTGRRLLNHALDAIAADVKTDSVKGIPVVVFNDLSWARSDVVEMNLPKGLKGAVHVVDAHGREVPNQITTLDTPDELDVAAAAQGATATASSEYSPAYSPEKAINGKWAVCDPSPEVGQPDKWNSAKGAKGPHWLVIDFGQPRTVFKVVIRHQGVVGMHGEVTSANTADFQIQSAHSPSGPWTDLVPPIKGNRFSLTTHFFAPKTFRYLRLYITKGTQTDNSYARIFEVQAFEKIPPKPKLLFLANNVPSLGYKTYYLVPGKLSSPATRHMASVRGYENAFYRIALVPGGVQSIYDKQQHRQLLDVSKFLGGEVFTMDSPGTGAGEFGAVEQPKMDASFDRVATHQPRWSLLEDGPVRTVYQLVQPLADTTVRERLVVWQQIRRVDFDVTLEHFNGDLYREFRMALPVALAKPQVTYEVPFGVVRIGKDEIPMTGGHAYGHLTYWQMCRDIRPRLVRDFVDASDARGGLTLSTSVSAFDWVDPTTNAPTGTLLQPILLASRRSCNGQGNWYVQAGDHVYRFSLTTHRGDWHRAWKPGIGANHPFHVVVGVTSTAEASLPPVMSFASVSANHVIISTLKKCEDDNQVVARLYDIAGQDSRVALRLFKPIASAERTSLLEEGGRPVSVSHGAVELRVGHNAIETLKLQCP